MANIPALNEADVVAWLGSGEVAKGRSYARNSIISPRLQGNTLKAMCQGNAPQPYRVEITLEKGKITRGHCSCPVGSGGGCKHAAALLLVWVNFPERFNEVVVVEEGLHQKSKDELIALITKMLDRHPDLETLVSMPSSKALSLDPGIVKRQVLSALENSYSDDDYGYGDYAYGLTTAAYDDLMELLNVTDHALDDSDATSAFNAYWTIAEELLENHDEYINEEGYFEEILGRCAEGIASALHATTDEAQRGKMLQALFDLYLQNSDFDSRPVSEMILEYATAEERSKVVSWLEDVMQKTAGQSDYRRRTYGAFLLELQADTLDDESFLRISRATGRSEDFIGRLIELNRLDEAVNALRQIEGYLFLRHIDIFKDAGQHDLAHELVLERSKIDNDNRILEWLRDDFKARGNLSKALELSETLFWKSPRLEGYQTMKKYAQSLGTWEKLNEAVLKRLEKNDNYDLLTEIHLLNANVEAALKTVTKVQRRGGGWSSWQLEPLSIRVAGAAEKDFPLKAIELYSARIAKLIEARGRESYARAAQHVLRVVALYQGLGQNEAASNYLAEVKNQKPRLPALLDELKRAGL